MHFRRRTYFDKWELGCKEIIELNSIELRFCFPLDAEMTV